MFKIEEFLNEAGIPYSLHGKNISQNWLGIDCPCCSDRSRHGGIPLTGTVFTCFKCGTKLAIPKLIALLENCSIGKARDIYAKYSDVLYIPDYIEIQRAAKVEWPPPVVSSTPLPAHVKYITDRNYDVQHLMRNYNIHFGGYTGDFKYRIIIPVYLNGKLVSYVGRDITNTSTLRYKNLREQDSVLPVKETVYNIDNVTDEAIICEGITDCWRFGFNAVALFGLVYTQKQVRLLGSKLKKAYICFDNEPQAEQAAEVLAEELSFQGVSTEILLIDTKDPGEMSNKEADLVKQELFGTSGNFF